MRYNFVNLAKQ